MKRSVRIIALILALVLVCSCFCVGAASSKASKINMTLAVYKGIPANITMNVDDTDEIKHAVRVQFRYRGLDSFGSIEKFVKNFSGTTIATGSLNWVSSNEEVAVAESGGKVIAKKKGTAYIYPVPKGVSTYKYCGKFIIYLKVSVNNGVKLYGGIGTKVKVNK